MLSKVDSFYGKNFFSESFFGMDRVGRNHLWVLIG